MASSADVRDILEIDRGVSEVTKESIIGPDRKNKVLFRTRSKKPEGMAREVFQLLYSDKKAVPPMVPSDDNFYKSEKANFSMKKARSWVWAPFNNSARTDGFQFHHWQRVEDTDTHETEYPFAKFNKKTVVPTYTEEEYKNYIECDDWSRQETDHLLDLCQLFDLRFIVIKDRWKCCDFPDKIKERSVEDLKERYYFIVSTLANIKEIPGIPDSMKTYVFDADHEKRRKAQLEKLYSRTKEQVEEEQMLMSEYRKIEARKKERDRKTQDLRKQMAADLQKAENTSKRAERKAVKKKSPVQPRQKTEISAGDVATIKFQEIKGNGNMLRSQTMKLPTNLGQKKMKIIDNMLQELNLPTNPTPTTEISTTFNDLRNDILVYCDLKAALTNAEFELQTIRHQYEALYPGKSLEIPKIFQITKRDNTADINTDGSGKHEQLLLMDLLEPVDKLSLETLRNNEEKNRNLCDTQ